MKKGLATFFLLFSFVFLFLFSFVFLYFYLTSFFLLFFSLLDVGLGGKHLGARVNLARCL
jgi:hypothetical protein